VESCTGGWIAKALTDIAGSSSWFEGGWVTYSNQAKSEWVGVLPDTLERYGAVSTETVMEMAAGALQRCPRADLSVAVSGVAGPGGGTEEKPVGLVWFGWSERRDGRIDTETDWVRFPGNRDAVRAGTVIHALEGVLRLAR
jgi:nicotinamide-nucleotide amidase